MLTILSWGLGKGSLSGRRDQEWSKNSVFDLKSIIVSSVLFCWQGRGIEHISQCGPGWPPNCHNLPASASQALGYKQYELNIAQDLRDPHSTLHTVLGCGVLGMGLREKKVS